MNNDLSSIYKGHKGKWVALDKNLKRVLSSGRNAVSVYNKAVKKDTGATLFKVPKKDVAFSASY